MAGPLLPLRRVRSLSCASGPLEAFVEAAVIERLSRPDAGELLVPRADVDVSALAQEANSLRARLINLGDVLESGDMSPAEYRSRKERLTKKLGAIEAEMTAAAGTSPLAGIAGRPDAADIWDGFSLAQRRAVIDTLVEVVVLPAEKRGKDFDRNRVALRPLT